MDAVRAATALASATAIVCLMAVAVYHAAVPSALLEKAPFSTRQLKARGEQSFLKRERATSQRSVQLASLSP